MRRIIQFIKEWTLPVSIATGSFLYLLFAFIPALDGAANFFAPILDAALPLFMFLVLYVTFCKVDFRKLIPVGWHLWIALSQVLMVAVVIGAILIFHITGESLILFEALLVSIICPCASAAAVVTQKLGGNLEEMTTYTFLSNFLCALLIPVCFPLIESGAGISFWGAFIAILYKVCLVLVAPMLLAYITKHWHTLCKFYQWVINVNNLSFYLWGCSLLIVSGTTVKNIVHAEVASSFLLLIAILALVLCLIQFAIGRYIGHFFCSTINAGQALGQKNTAFAIWIAYTYLNPLSTVGPGCYILWQNIINSVEIWQHDHAIKRKNK
ncbi:transporter [Prevotella melaninogenica]|uniref:sodium bile acid symporter family protein n=1 Tax=Prevotella TaxID=838 RepID=UPI0003AD006F|nr:MULTISPECIES: sodium bile acid symporter family protein [Prevotella]ERJ79842.1 sodium bile acid symporter family protein [Prevotella sp. F0091]QUB72728.1 transporter [Prevotella melaninogenica]